MIRRGLLTALLLLAGCKDEAGPQANDAGTVQRKLAAEGVSVMLPTGWVVQSPSGGPTVRAKGDAVETAAAATRVGDRGQFLVPPKIVLTVEPTARVDEDEVFRSTLGDLTLLGETPGVTVTRSALSTRFVQTTRVGDIELAYVVRVPKKEPQEVVQRSIVILRRRADGSRAIVTVTVTYMNRDTEAVSREVQSIMNTLHIKKTG